MQGCLLFLHHRYLVQRGHANSLACPRGGLWSSLPLLLLELLRRLVRLTTTLNMLMDAAHLDGIICCKEECIHAGLVPFKTGDTVKQQSGYISPVSWSSFLTFVKNPGSGEAS